MGRGDKKSRKGKIAKGSYGNTRPRDRQKKLVSAEENTKETTKKK